MSKNLVIVESPAKAKTIEKYLGKDFRVLSSVGHIRSIVKKTKDGTPPIDVTNGFKTQYEVDPEKKKVVTELKKAAREADQVYLATDPDREGEAISWHLCEVLGLDPKTTKRITYHEISKAAVEQAIKDAHTVDMDLVQAQQARQILDRLVGFELSPVVWQKVPGGKSAGRVQSPAVRLLVEREREIAKFEGSFQFKVTAQFIVPADKSARAVSNPSSPDLAPPAPSGVAKEGDEAVENGELVKAELPQRFDTEAEAQKFLESLQDATFTVTDITTSPASRNPGAPFTTSTLQQEANAKLGFGSKATMASAQKLYQEGKITYMRTDSVNLSGAAIASAKDYITSTYGAQYSQVRQFKTKSASAQEAHEAIRPTNMALERGSSNEYDQKLYNLIRTRALASQMAPAKLEKTTVTIAITAKSGDANLFSADLPPSTPSGVTKEAEKTVRGERERNYHFEAKGEVIIFDGFLKVYGASKKDAEILPAVTSGDTLDLAFATAKQTFARPPARYTEGSLVKKLEELGIGRPSTYATIIGTIQERGYVEKGEGEGTPRDVIVLSYPPVTDSAPARVAGGGAAPASDNVPDISEEGANHPTRLEPSELRKTASGSFDDASGAPKEITVTNGVSRQIITEKTGADKGKLIPTPSGELIADFLSNHFDQIVDYSFTANVEQQFDQIATGALARNTMLERFYKPFHQLIVDSGGIDRSTVGASREIGIDPKTGKPIIARFGRFGPMLQLGTTDDKDDKPKFAPMPNGAKIDTVTLDQALYAFKLPRDVGQTPDGQPIKANIGRFGPYIQVGKLFVSIKPLDPHDITLDQALQLYDAKLKAEAEKNIADFGDGVKVLNGRFGPYVTDGKKNAKIPKDTDPKSITHDQAKQMLADAPAGKKGRFAKRAAKK